MSAMPVQIRREPRAPRPPRSPAPALPAFETLEHAHQSALKMLQHLDALIQELELQGIDDKARRSAREVLDYFNGPGLDHHAQEELHVFPTLLASGDAELVHHVQRLRQDHGWIEEDWRELEPQVQAVADGYTWYDLPMLRAAMPVFQGLVQEHIALEECVVYPAARNLLRHARH